MHKNGNDRRRWLFVACQRIFCINCELNNWREDISETRWKQATEEVITSMVYRQWLGEMAFPCCHRDPWTEEGCWTWMDHGWVHQLYVHSRRSHTKSTSDFEAQWAAFRLLLGFFRSVSAAAAAVLVRSCHSCDNNCWLDERSVLAGSYVLTRSRKYVGWPNISV